jgi:hypothetical protein
VSWIKNKAYYVQDKKCTEENNSIVGPKALSATSETRVQVSECYALDNATWPKKFLLMNHLGCTALLSTDRNEFSTSLEDTNAE